ncbi:subtilisin-type proteinase [Paenibacillus mucilaginosus 3016]|uniref:Subtilisin-type proteinase n=1 Tax=Paenibacillus mucilaginosus 3016 TaxID=1116391 RepID=H6NT42_9BACL|nr:S8 family serine peptidase [Paenibacillus mucilaginosus]AFC27055.1 subtilisin-type proteinase [Paenibacillus mucilaginosus 3016]WFA15990.1 peptidase S8 [Paenibacillus mucilaginosus]
MNATKWKLSTLTSLTCLALCLTFTQAARGAEASDPLAAKQTYLGPTGMTKAWDISKGAGGVTIAIVDTGVDLNHPDLKGNLVPGVNLIQPGQPPADDNGHGTNVAGIIGAAGGNDKGIAGMLWQARIMPVKALEADGSGGETMLGEGIRYAVDHGAKIVVLSLGLNKYSDYLSEIVKYAESKDVLLVAATGNEGNRVKYPAAYPTVLAVGGMTAGGAVDTRSNTGPEVDVVAPWNVFTTALGGSYEAKDGTSMAAPQVAAAAALLWERYPQMKAHQIRQWVRQTAQDLGPAGWDPGTGYGLLRVDRLLSERIAEDMYEPNDRKDQAKTVSNAKSVTASFASGTDADWYVIDAQYDGTVSLSFAMDSSMTVSAQHTDASGVLSAKTVQGGGAVTFPVSKGRSYVQLQLKDRGQAEAVPYRMTTSFEIYRDAFEDNDRQFKASVLPSRTLTVKGTFHQTGDTDWYEFPVPESGSMRIRLTSDTARIDPVLLVQKQGEKSVTVDYGDDGAEEGYELTEVFPGSYYIRVTNVKEYANAVVGEYTLKIEYDAKLADPNEPNNKSYQATVVSLDTPYTGLLDKPNETDWFQFRVEQESRVGIGLTDIPAGVSLYMHLYDGSMRSIASSMNEQGSAVQSLTGRLEPGTYYVKLTSSVPFDNRMYELTVEAKPLLGGYTDVSGHWAQSAILTLSGRGVINGYEDYLFQPDRPITRAEATAVLTRAYGLTKEKEIAYSDLGSGHWAYTYIARAAQAGIIEGYPDRTFAPDQPVSRMEMTAMLARGAGMSGKRRGAVPFTDVDESYWGTGLLKQMKAEGLIGGYADGTFRPDQQATRAEFVQLLAGMLK